ncbi:MAG: HepT-like ribonuclease domain-containing protein [Coriobacteriia bacterium]|nr:HepT-like ribonuclease domain-containing protein [Coriobacteriia bacterium]
MPRSALAYLEDILEACDGIALALHGVDLAGYESDRVIRSAVEREFIIIGEAVNSLARLDPELAAGISNARKVVAFRNQLTHDYASIDDETVWAIAYRDVPVLRSEVAALLEARGERPNNGIQTDNTPR